MQSVNLSDFRSGIAGRPFRAFVQHHINKQSSQSRRSAVAAIPGMLPAAAQGLPERFVDRWNSRAYERSFWEMDCALVLDEVIADARAEFESLGIEPDDWILFNMFQLVTLNFAYSAEKEPGFRSFAGLKASGKDWVGSAILIVSGLALVNVTQNALLLIVGWLFFGVGVLPLLAKLRR